MAVTGIGTEPDALSSKKNFPSIDQKEKPMITSAVKKEIQTQTDDRKKGGLKETTLKAPKLEVSEEIIPPIGSAPSFPKIPNQKPFTSGSSDKKEFLFGQGSSFGDKNAKGLFGQNQQSKPIAPTSTKIPKPFASTFNFGVYSGLGKHKKSDGASQTNDLPPVEEKQPVREETPDFITQLEKLSLTDKDIPVTSSVAGSLDSTLLSDDKFEEEEDPAQKATAEQIPDNDEELLKLTSKMGHEECKFDSLKVPLFKHQVVGLSFLLRREKAPGIHKGGLLCDDMGLGKTLQTIALIAEHRMDPKLKDHCKTTLILAPPGLIDQWVEEIQSKAKDLTVLKYHGSQKQWVDGFDVAIASIHTFASEVRLLGNASPFYKNKFWRVVIDEAHYIRNPTGQKARALLKIEARNRWCLTGTPIHNTLNDIYTLFLFIRLEDFQGLSHELPPIKPSKDKDTTSIEPIRNILQLVMLRRTKNILKQDSSAFNLKEKRIHDIKLTLSTIERKLYDDFQQHSIKAILDEEVIGNDVRDTGTRFRIKESVMGAFDAASDSKTYMAILTLILRLRQLCCNWQIIYSAEYLPSSRPTSDNSGSGTSSENDDLENLTKGIKSLSVGYQCVCCSKPVSKTSAICASCEPLESIKQSTVLNAKLREMTKILAKTQERKTVIFTFFVAGFGFIEEVLKRMNIGYLTYHGGMPVGTRTEVLKEMKQPENRVLICSLACASVGLNLVFADQVILMDPWWNPQVELQAIDRVYRIGQLNDVDIYKLSVEDTVESRILELQQQKIELAKGVLDSQKTKFFKSFSIQDAYKVLGIKKGMF